MFRSFHTVQYNTVQLSTRDVVQNGEAHYSTCYIYLICWRCVGLFLVLQIAAAAVPDSVAQTA